MKQKEMILRAHHGMCLAFFEGKGYSDSFTSHMEQVAAMLQENPGVQIVAKGDMICEKCPNWQEGRCLTQDKVEEYDRQVLLKCGLSGQERTDWKSFFRLVEEKILKPGRRREICGDCQWDELCTKKEGERKYETGDDD